jgi:DNA modification methylase
VLKPAWEPIAVLAKPPVPWANRTLQPELKNAYRALGRELDWERVPAWAKALEFDQTILEALGIIENRLYIPKPSTREKNEGLRGRSKVLTRGTGWTKSEQENPHESKKPVDLMERLVRYASREGELVLDPFCGSGTTGVACVNIGRRFIGVEREADYVEIAAGRVVHAEKQTTPKLVQVRSNRPRSQHRRGRAGMHSEKRVSRQRGIKMPRRLR